MTKAAAGVAPESFESLVRAVAATLGPHDVNDHIQREDLYEQSFFFIHDGQRSGRITDVEGARLAARLSGLVQRIFGEMAEHPVTDGIYVVAFPTAQPGRNEVVVHLLAQSAASSPLQAALSALGYPALVTDPAPPSLPKDSSYTLEVDDRYFLVSYLQGGRVSLRAWLEKP